MSRISTATINAVTPLGIEIGTKLYELDPAQTPLYEANVFGITTFAIDQIKNQTDTELLGAHHVVAILGGLILKDGGFDVPTPESLITYEPEADVIVQKVGDSLLKGLTAQANKLSEELWPLIKDRDDPVLNAKASGLHSLFFAVSSQMRARANSDTSPVQLREQLSYMKSMINRYQGLIYDPVFEMWTEDTTGIEDENTYITELSPSQVRVIRVLEHYKGLVARKLQPDDTPFGF
jgi:hypothetical protein